MDYYRTRVVSICSPRFFKTQIAKLKSQEGLDGPRTSANMNCSGVEDTGMSDKVKIFRWVKE